MSTARPGCSFEFFRSSGPGGQNVNKVETAVRLRFDPVAGGLDAATRLRLLALAGRAATAVGIVVLVGRRHRTREANRKDTLARLERLLERASRVPRVRRATRPTAGSAARRRSAKIMRGEAKRGRSVARTDED